MNRQIKRISILIIIIGVTSISTLALSKSDKYRKIANSQRLINDVYKYLVTYYVDDIDIDKFTNATVSEMVNRMDPYTDYLIEDERDGLDLLTTGKYGGIGIQISRRDEALTVIAPMEDTPAQRAGIIGGDVIIQINETTTSDLSLSQASKLIRGKKGTKVVLLIKRFGYENTMEFELTRAEIRIKDVPYAEMLDEHIGYIRLTRFSSNSIIEMKSALNKLSNAHADAIILDIRDNPGGLLHSAVEILDMFVDKDELLLSTQGRIKGSSRTYYAKRKPLVGGDVKLAVLINEGSASASEIIAGVIQDLDRGLVIGKTSFGKGLVQSVVNLEDNKILKITTAKYYMPSGRLIQKPNYIDNDLIITNSNPDSIFTTSNGRIVIGSGGISPDIEIDDIQFQPLTVECFRRGAFFSFIQNRKHQYTSFTDVLYDDNLLDGFIQYIEEIEINIPVPGEMNFFAAVDEFKEDAEDIAELESAFAMIESYIEKRENAVFESEKDILYKNLIQEFAHALEGDAGRFRERLKKDPTVIRAQEILREGSVYEQIFLAEK
ncbi:MAG: S41 family peptidase [Candidatus Neomarinimicrobiota bacterium]